jgi:RNA recognition motif-containing protein
MDGMPCPSVAIDQIKTRYTAVLERYRDESQAIPQEEWTSIMIKNIPCRYVQDEILDEIKSAGYVLDFLYLPPARRTAGNLGYCFVNFVTPAQARDFFEAFQGHHFALQPKSKKRANVLWANLQGFQKNCEFYQNAKVMKSKFQPFVDRAAHVQYAYERKCAE